MTNWNILLEPATNGQTTATVFGLPSFKVTAKDRQTALDQIQQLIKQWLARISHHSCRIPLDSAILPSPG